jgi:hypothetical protein
MLIFSTSRVLLNGILDSPIIHRRGLLIGDPLRSCFLIWQSTPFTRYCTMRWRRISRCHCLADSPSSEFRCMRMMRLFC